MTCPRPSSRGFTLVELMASMVVGMIVLLAAVSMLGNTGDGYERLNGGIGAEREARALLGQLTADLASAKFHDETHMGKGPQNWPLDRLGFLTLQPKDAQTEENRIGDLCAVRYYVKDERIGGKTVRCLMRGFTESADTFAALSEKTLGPLFAQPATSDTPHGGTTDEAIAFGVVSFEARPKTRESSGKLTDWKPASEKPPDVLALRLVLARRELAGKLNTAADWSGAGTVTSLMGKPAEAARNKNFQVYEFAVRFGYP